MSKLQKIDKLESKARKRSAKRSQRKDELADAAIEALKQLGYARTSLRDIAELSGVSVGMMHYYFEDKSALINYCVRKYKAVFVDELDSIMRDTPADDLVAERFASGLCDSIRREAETHRLWYDIRSQALFDVEFRDAVDEIEAELLALVVRFLGRLDLPEDMALDGYLGIDGAFRYYLQRHLGGDEAALARFRRSILAQVDLLMLAAGRRAGT